MPERTAPHGVAMKIIHISFGGPDRRIVDGKGKEWVFEMHPRFGPAELDKRGNHKAKQPGERSAFWTAITEWVRQGARVDNAGVCLWEPSKAEFAPVWLGGRNYAPAGSALAKKYGREGAQQEGDDK